VIDLESSNGTFVNNNKIEPRRYVELREKVRCLVGHYLFGLAHRIAFLRQLIVVSSVIVPVVWNQGST